MPKKIVPETCRTDAFETRVLYLPVWNLNEKDIERFSEKLTKYMKRYEPAFQRHEGS